MNALTILILWIVSGLAGYIIRGIEIRNRHDGLFGHSILPLFIVFGPKPLLVIASYKAGNYIWKVFFGPAYLIYSILRYGEKG